LEEQKKELRDHSFSLEKMVSNKTKTVFDLQNAILKTVAELVESRDNITGGHIERTQSYLNLFMDFLLEHEIYAEELSSWDIDLFVHSSQLHDVGKISIKDGILMKPGNLTGEEFEEMKKHALYGMGIIEKIEGSTPGSAFLNHAKIMAGSHHEKWDGSGYPFGLKGEAIPLQGRMMAIVDVYDALTNDRPYKKAFSHEESIEIIKKGTGTHFDPVLEDIFARHEKEFKHLMEAGKMPPVTVEETPTEPHGIAWKSVSQAVATIIDIRSTIQHSKETRLRRYLTIFLNALLMHKKYQKEVSRWDQAVLLYQLPANTGTFPNAEKPAESKQPEALQNKLIAIVNMYDTLIHDCSLEEMSHKEAIETIKERSGTYFDPELVTIFLEYEKDFIKIESDL
jgi:HD-GYP domain-containing protein (c-di-GMP phosphodiesterase class II)